MSALKKWGGPHPKMWTVNTLMLQYNGNYEMEQIRVQTPTMYEALRLVRGMKEERHEDVLKNIPNPRYRNPAIRSA